MSMKQKVLNMITEANTTTGESDTNLTDAVASLIDGYGGITPTGTINITDTSLTDVSDYANAQVVDADLIASNIKKDVNILGVTGTFEGGGSTPTKGFVPTAWDSAGNVTSGVWYGSTMPERAIGVYNDDSQTSYTKNLGSVDISGLQTIPKYAFAFCRKLSAVNFSDELTTIDNFGFSRTGFVSLVLPNSVTTLGTYAFRECNDLKAITFTAIASLQSNTFTSCTKLLDIYVPWANGEVGYAPWGATNATIHYNWTPTE